MALDLIAELESILDALAAETIEYAVCGGLALGILGHPRMTKDIDLLSIGSRSSIPRPISYLRSISWS